MLTQSATDRSPWFLRARAEPHPGWLLVWLPLLLIAFEGSPDLSSAMVRLAGVLLLGIVAWGTGRGPAGPWAERSFAALLLVGWFAVCGTWFRLHGVPAAMPARLAVTAVLLLGPLFLLWAWWRRARMAPVVNEVGLVAASGSAAGLLMALVLVALALFVLERLFGLERADLMVIGTGLVLFANFRVRGRHQELGALG